MLSLPSTWTLLHRNAKDLVASQECGHTPALHFLKLKPPARAVWNCCVSFLKCSFPCPFLNPQGRTQNSCQVKRQVGVRVGGITTPLPLALPWNCYHSRTPSLEAPSASHCGDEAPCAAAPRPGDDPLTGGRKPEGRNR